MFRCCLSAVVLYWILMMSFTFACQAEKETDGVGWLLRPMSGGASLFCI